MHRILHVVGTRWWSAIAAHAVDLATAQRDAGHAVGVAALRDSPSEAELLRRDFTPAIRFGARPWQQLHFARELRKVIETQRVDLLHVHTGVGHAAAEVARSRASGATRLIRTRGDIRAPRATPGNRFLYRRADHVVVTGRFQRPGVIEIGVREDAVSVVIGPVDTTRFRPEALAAPASARRALGLPETGILIGQIARLSPVKGHRVAIGALARVRSPHVHLVVAGEEFQVKRDDLRSLARERGVAERVHHLDRVQEVRDLIAAIDIGLVASTGSEAICRIAAELMACGRPVIASDVSVLPEMVSDGETGRLVPPGDETAMAAAMDELTSDRGGRERMGRRAIERAAAWSFPAVATRYEKIYEKVGR